MLSHYGLTDFIFDNAIPNGFKGRKFCIYTFNANLSDLWIYVSKYGVEDKVMCEAESDKSFSGSGELENSYLSGKMGTDL